MFILKNILDHKLSKRILELNYICVRVDNNLTVKKN